jgi:hypothetical protein
MRSSAKIQRVMWDEMGFGRGAAGAMEEEEEDGEDGGERTDGGWVGRRVSSSVVREERMR